MNHCNKESGFTLIELMLAMAFVSILLLAIAMTVMQMGAIYNKGLTLKEVNQTGRAINNDLKSTISSELPFDIKSGPASRYIVQDWGGRLCVGQYSYIWNYGRDIVKNDVTRLNIYDGNSSAIRLIKVIDADGSYCTDQSKKIVKNDSVELLEVGEHNLAIHSFKISSADTAMDAKTGQQLYNIDLTLGTNDQNAITVVNNVWQCKAPGVVGADLSYCSISNFNFVVLAGNSLK